tara:strand:- start:447 stop:686 length:240 start_codon:yes stop_codon:yes gene_type:complete
MKITRETLQQIIKEEVAKEMNEEYSPQVEVALKKMMEIAQEMGLSQGVMDDLMAIKVRHGGMKPSGEPVGDIDMSGYDI